MIAIALSAKPSLLIADEPHECLDITLQAQVLTLMKELMEEVRTRSVSSATTSGHPRMADDVGVLYAGHLVEFDRSKRCTRTLAPVHEAAHPRDSGRVQRSGRCRVAGSVRALRSAARLSVSSSVSPGEETYALPTGPRARTRDRRVLSVSSRRVLLQRRSGEATWASTRRGRHLMKRFRSPGPSPPGRRASRGIRPRVDDVSLAIYPGETLGLHSAGIGVGQDTLAGVRETSQADRRADLV